MTACAEFLCHNGFHILILIVCLLCDNVNRISLTKITVVAHSRIANKVKCS